MKEPATTPLSPSDSEVPVPSVTFLNWGRLDGTWGTEDLGPLSPVCQHYGSYGGPINWVLIFDAQFFAAVKYLALSEWNPDGLPHAPTKSLEGIKKVPLGRDSKISTRIDLEWKQVNRTCQMYTFVCAYCSTFNLIFAVSFCVG